MAASRCVGLAAVVFQFEHVLEDRKAALGARDAETCRMKPSRLRQQAKDFSSRAMYSATILATMPCR